MLSDLLPHNLTLPLLRLLVLPQVLQMILVSLRLQARNNSLQVSLLILAEVFRLLFSDAQMVKSS